MDAKERIKKEPGYTIAALLYLAQIPDGFLPEDANFLHRLASRYAQTKKLTPPQISIVAKMLVKYSGSCGGLDPIGMPDEKKEPKIKKPVGDLEISIGKDVTIRGADDALLAVIKAELTMNNPEYDDAITYGRFVGAGVTAKLKFFTEADGSIVCPRGFFDKARELAPEAKVFDTRKTLPPIDFTFEAEKRSYQRRAIWRILKTEDGVLESGTGSGKTVMAMAVIAERGQPTLILVHSKELLHQWAERLKSFLGITAGLLGDGQIQIEPVTVAIINSAKNHLEKLHGKFGHIIVDECHRVPSTMFTNVVCSFDCKYLLGLSATAFRRDGLSILIPLYLGGIRHQVPTEALHKSGAILKPKFVQRRTEFEFDYKDNYSKMLSELTKNPDRNNLIIQDIAEVAQNHSGTILVVSDRVEHCSIFEEALGAKGYSVALLTGETPAEERAEIVLEVNGGQIEILIATIQLIGEGFDCEGLCTLFLTTPIAFEGRLRQVIGRIVRPAQGKEAVVYDYRDQVPVLERSARTRLILNK